LRKNSQLEFYYCQNPTATRSSWDSLINAAMGCHANPEADHYSDSLLDQIDQERAIHRALCRIPWTNQLILKAFYEQRRIDNTIKQLFGNLSNVVLFLWPRVSIKNDRISEIRADARAKVQASIKLFEEEFASQK
jgi:hypothetical protein